MLVLAKQGNIDSFLTRQLVGGLSGRDRHEEALELLRAALQTDPLNIDLLLAQANLYRNTDRPEEAKQPLLTALKIAPENPEPHRQLAWLANSQENFVEAQDWFRKALIADPEDPEIVSGIAGTFYIFGLLSEGDRWFERVRAMAPERVDLMIDLEIRAAAAAQDQDRQLEVLERALPLVLTGEADYFLTTIYYPSVMGARGRSQEALDYLTELIPELQDYSKLIDTGRFEQYLQVVSFPLQKDLMDRGSFQRLAQGFAKVVEAQYPWISDTTAPAENTINKVLYRTWLGDHDQALELILEGHADWPMFSGQWKQLQIYPWLEDLRQDPDVALAIEEYEQKKARIAAELREMVEQPEWQLDE
jgi:Tfp pilus assembly protein PilF